MHDLDRAARRRREGLEVGNLNIAVGQELRAWHIMAKLGIQIEDLIG